LTRRTKPGLSQRRRRSEETGRAFRTAAGNVLRRVVQLPGIASAVAVRWDTLDWLNPWHGNDSAPDSEMDEGSRYTEQNHLSPRL